VLDMQTFIDKVVNKVAAELRNNPQWSPEVEAQLRKSLDVIYKGRFAAIWIPSIEQIGGVYKLRINKKTGRL